MRKQKTILISIDGLRGDFFDVYDETVISNLKKFAQEGCYAPDVLNQFCTLTLPNHVSIATGLYAENHGFVANTMFDREMEELWSSWAYKYEPLSDDHDNADKVRRWWDHGLCYPGEPIWVTNQKFGGKSGIFEWPAACGLLCGESVEKLVIRPDQDSIYKRMDTVLSWLDTCDFIAMYIPELDVIEHEDGPFGQKTLATLREVDGGIGYLLSELRRMNLWEDTNLVVTSDHGHVEIDPAKVVSLDRYLDKSSYIRKDLSFWPIGCTSETLYSKLTAVPFCRVYLRDELTKMHYSQHQRIGPVVMVPEAGACHCREHELGQRWTGRGNHGYDPFSCQAMRPPLICIGPAFKSHQKITHVVDQTDIYLLLCACLDIRPAPCNGDISRINNILA